MSIICPNFSNPDVARDFNELVEATSEKAAYAIWSLNNGNAIDKAPNGALSKLFEDLLNYFGGDRVKAIKAKANTFSKPFMDWFGDWTHGKETENIENIIQQYANLGGAIGNAILLLIDNYSLSHITKIGFRPDSSGVYELVTRELEIPYLWEDDPPHVVKNNKVIALHELIHSITSPILFLYVRDKGWAELIYGGTYEDSIKIYKLTKDLINAIENLYKIRDVVSDYITKNRETINLYLVLPIGQQANYFLWADGDPRLIDEFVAEVFSNPNLLAILKQIPYKSENKNTNIFKVFVDAIKRIIGIPIENTILEEAISAIETVASPFEKNKEKNKSVSKVVDLNGEPLVVWHGGAKNITAFKLPNPNSGLIDFTTLHNIEWADYEGYNITEEQRNKYNTEGYIENATKPVGIYFAKDQVVSRSYFGARNEEDTGLYAVYLNIKNPNTSNKQGKQMIDDAGTVKDLQNAIDNGNDGVIIEDIRDYGPNDEERMNFDTGEFADDATTDYIVFNSNQIKSINNDGTFTDGDNIYHNLKSSSPKSANEIASVIEDILRDYYNFHRYYGLKETINNRNRAINEDVILNVERIFGFPTGTIQLSENGTGVKINKRLIQDNIEQFRNSINHSTVTYYKYAINLVEFMKSKFPQIKGIKFAESSEWNGRFKDGYVYLNFNSSLDVAAEECLHPFVEAIFSENKQLFDQLLNEAQKDFKELRAEIAKTYSDKKGFSVQDRQKELVTLAFARHFSEVFEEENNIEGKKSKSIWQKAWDWILEKLGVSGVKELGKDMTLRLLAEAVFKANNISISDTYFVDEKFNLSQELQEALNQSITRQMYDIGVNIDTKRQLYIRSIVDQYKLSNPNADQASISRVMNNARKSFDTDKSNQIMQLKQLILAQSLGLSMNQKGFFESSETTLKKLMLEHFINSLQEATFKAYSLENINRGKYELVGAVLSAGSVANVLYNAIYNGDLTTLDKELARDYVRMFWTSPLIQSALDVLNTNNKTAKLIEDDLVEHMTKDPVSERGNSIIDWFRNIWQQLNQLVHTVFGAHVFTDQQKEDILKAVDAAFMVAEDMELAQEGSKILDREDGNFSTSDLLSDKDKSILSDIYNGTKTRLRSQQARTAQDPKLISDLKSRLEIIDGKDLDSIEDTFNIIEDFLLFANKEIGQTQYMIDSKFLVSGDMSTWDPQEINFILQDLIGHYDSLLNSIFELFSDKSSAINKYNEHRVNTDPNKVDLKNVVSQLIRSIDSIKKDYNLSIVKPYVRKILTDYVNEQDAITDKKTFIYNMERWLEQDSTYGDLAAGEVLIGMASRSKSPIVRIVEKMASEAEFETNREVLKKGNELVRLYNKIRPAGSQISPHNWQKRFMELDRNGVSTGYFIRELNEGQFFKDKDEYEAQLRSEFGLTADEDGYTIFPEEEFIKDDSIYNKYNDKLDEWLDERCNRRYKLEYYKARRRHLSPKTIQAQNRIQRQIDLILDKCRMESGLVDLSKLTLNERHQLEQYRREKRDLGSHYIFTYGSDGILRVEEKVGDALKMADEISEWNKYITDKVKYKPDWTAFNKAISDMQAAGATQEEIDLFKRNNTVMRLTPEFYDLLHKVVGKAATSPKLELLKHRHKEILNALKERQGAVAHNLSKLGSGLNTDLSGWKELHRLEQEMANEKRRLKTAGIKGQPGEIESMGFSEVATMLYVPISDTDQTAFLPTLIEQWRSAAVSNTNLHNIFNELFMYRDEKGKMRYLNAFKYLTPLKYTLTVNNKSIDCIQSLPGSEYSELDESSPFVNENFNKNGKSMLVKDMYKNEDYANLTDDEKTFLNDLLKAMDEANSRIPNKSLNRDGRLPQISGRTMSVIANTMMAKEWSTALKYPFRKFGVKYSETDVDVTTNMDLARRPDGSVVNNIPIRFVEKLPDSSVQSTDVLGSVIMYYDMACNYANKSKNLPTLELIKYAIDPAQAKNGNKMDDQYAKVENILDQRYYGKETSFGFNSEEKITPAKQRTIQGTKTIRNLAAVAMLGVNFTTIEVGYIDALCSMLADAVGGKYLTGVDMRKAFAQCIAHTGKMLKGIGNPVVHDKLVAAMLYNLLSRSNSEIFSSTDKFKFDRFVHDHLLMGGYTLADYMINSMMLTATYNHYRLIKDPKTGKDKFFSKTDAINTFTSLGYTEKEAIKQWKASKTTLWDAYEEKDGLFVKKAEYENIITKKLEDQIAGRLRDRTAMYNGIVPMTEKAKMQQNIFGSFVTLMRNFYVNTYWDKFKTGGDYVVEDGDHHIGWTSEYKRDDLGLVNLETGEFEGAVFKDFCRGMYKLAANYKHAFRSGFMDTLIESQSYAVKRCLTEIGTITALMFLMLWSVAFARSNNYDDDKDPVWLLNIAGLMPWREEKFLTFDFDNADKKFFDFLRWKLALLSTRGFTERLTSWWPPTVLELFTSPSTAKSYLDDVCTIWDLSLDMFSQHADDEIKTGGYKHMTRRTRDVLKLGSAFGVDNLVRQWHTDGIKSTFNYYRKLTPTSAIVPSLSEWNEEHGLGKHGGQKSENKLSKKKKSSGFAY